MDAIATDLLAWYDKQRRALPWRDEVSPYRTWISEVMLQQTRVEAVLPYFARFMARFPTVDALATAPLDDVLALWSGLGYYSRARNLHAAAKQIAASGFPQTLSGLQALPGVGEYIAGAIGSIALQLDEPAVDGNLHRVLSRLHRSTGNRKAMWALARLHLPAGRAGDFNQALMDLGSMVCKSKAPACTSCPLRAHCKACSAGAAADYPIRPPRRIVPQRSAVCGVWQRDGALLMVRRPAEGLYGGMYELPGAALGPEESAGPALVRAIAQRLGLAATVGAPLGSVKHTLTHMKLTLHVLPLHAAGEPQLRYYTDAQWVAPSQLAQLGTSTLVRKALKVATTRQRALF